MEAKCNCRHCDTHIAFDAAEAGAVVACPSCGMETQLFIPPPAFKPAAAVLPQMARAPKDAPATERLEDRLERLAGIYFGAFCVFGALIICDAFLAITQEAITRAFLDIVGAVAAIGQGYVVKTVFQYLAEHLRLTRKMSNV